MCECLRESARGRAWYDCQRGVARCIVALSGCIRCGDRLLGPRAGSPSRASRVPSVRVPSPAYLLASASAAALASMRALRSETFFISGSMIIARTEDGKRPETFTAGRETSRGTRCQQPSLQPSTHARQLASRDVRRTIELVVPAAGEGRRAKSKYEIKSASDHTCIACLDAVSSNGPVTRRLSQSDGVQARTRAGLCIAHVERPLHARHSGGDEACQGGDSATTVKQRQQWHN